MNFMPFSFELIKQDSLTSARLGKMVTDHGIVETPVFMPVGTQGTVKSLRPEEIQNCGAQIILGNTYHLYLRPGHETIRKAGWPAFLHELAGTDPDGQRRISGLLS